MNDFEYYMKILSLQLEDESPIEGSISNIDDYELNSWEQNEDK